MTTESTREPSPSYEELQRLLAPLGWPDDVPPRGDTVLVATYRCHDDVAVHVFYDPNDALPYRVRYVVDGDRFDEPYAEAHHAFARLAALAALGDRAGLGLVHADVREFADLADEFVDRTVLS